MLGRLAMNLAPSCYGKTLKGKWKMEKIKTDNKEEKKPIEKNTTKTEAEPKVEVNNEVAEMMKAMDLMKKQMAAQEELIKRQGEALTKLSEAKASDSNGNNAELISLLKGLQNNANNQTMNMVKVTCLEDCGGAQFRLQNGMVIKFLNEGDGTYGKIVPVSMSDAILLLNEYTQTFMRGALKFDEDHMYMLREKGIDVDKINYKPMESIQNFPNLDKEGIAALYNSLRAFQKDMLKTYIVRLINAGKADEELADKIKILNRLSKADSIDGKTGLYETILEKLKEINID